MESIYALQPVTAKTLTEQTAQTGGSDDLSFKELLQSAYYQVNGLQMDAEKKAGEVVSGDAASFHEAIIAAEKAALALQLMVQFQNKAVDAYNEIMRLQL